MERSDFGSSDTGTSGGVDDVSFGKTAGSGSTPSTPSTPSTSDTEVSAIGGSSDTATADASGSADLSTGTVAEGRLATAKQKLGVAKERVVDRVHATADWIKEKDIDQIKTGIEAQVRDHPGRTLLIAVGLGYLIGRAFRGGNSA
jgi:ElaB/YqjD/DUF883 family membrane-anchored ribosome-binding protein